MDERLKVDSLIERGLEVYELRALLREAVDFVGAGELKRDDLWPQMLAWHRKVSKLLGIENEWEPE